MLKRQPDIAPNVKRARRIRAAFLAAGAAALVAGLLVTAWAGMALARKEPPTHLKAAAPPDGELVFDIAAAAERSAAAVSGDDRRRADFLRERFEAIRATFHSEGQLLYWRGAAGGEDRWLCYLPVVRANRLFVRRIERILEDSGLFAPEGSARDAAGYYRVTAQGIAISSAPAFPETLSVPAPAPCGKMAVYRSAACWMPEQIARRLPPAAPQPRGTAALEIAWESGARIVVSQAGAAPAAVAAAQSHPLVDSAP